MILLVFGASEFSPELIVIRRKDGEEKESMIFQEKSSFLVLV